MPVTGPRKGSPVRSSLKRSGPSTLRRGLALAASAGLLTALTAACSSAESSSDGAGSNTAAATGDTASVVAEAQAEVDAAIKGTWREPAPGPTAVTGKKIFIIPCGIAAIGCYTPAQGVEEAAKDLGWTTTMVDGKLNPAGYTEALNQAISQKPDGIVTVGIGCEVATASYQAAKDAGIPVVGLYNVACTDPKVGLPEDLFTLMNAGTGQDNAEFFSQWGRIRADYLIAKTEGKAKTIQVDVEGFSNIDYINLGFEERMAQCPECEIVGKVNLTSADTVNQQINTKVTSGLLANPDANSMYFDNDGNLTLAVPALKANPHPDWIITGSEGLPTTIPLVGKEISVIFGLPPDWLGWCGAYTMNEVLAGHEVTDCGLGWQIVDAENNPQPAGAASVTPNIDFRAIMRAQWAG